MSGHVLGCDWGLGTVFEHRRVWSGAGGSGGGGKESNMGVFGHKGTRVLVE